MNDILGVILIFALCIMVAIVSDDVRGDLQDIKEDIGQIKTNDDAVRQRNILSDAIRYKLDNDTVPMENVLKDMDIDIDDLMEWVYAY